jgi:hypothetical protein
MLSVATPLDDFFATLYSQTGTTANGSHVYSSIGEGGLGWIPATFAEFVTPWVSYISANYPSQKLIGYESGQSFYATDNGTATGWAALVTAAERDARMGTAYTTYYNNWKSIIGGTAANIIHHYNDVGGISQFGAWGALESVMQTISPLSSAPPKYQALQNYIG